MDTINFCLLALAFISFISAIAFLYSSKSKFPPGPKSWPIIGNLNLIGPIPHKSLHSLSQTHGPIMLLHFGKFPVVVASSPDMAKHFLKTHDAVFASRPPLAAGKYTAYNYSDMGWAPYGHYWRMARMIYMSEFFTAKRLDASEPIRSEERRNFMARMFSLSGKPVVLRDQLVNFTLSTACRMSFGDKYFDGEEKHSIARFHELKGMLDEWFLLNGVFNVGDWIKWLDCLDLQGYIKRMKALSKKFDQFLSYVIEDHKARKAAEKDGFVAVDMVDVLVQREDDPNPEGKLTSDSVKGLLQDLLVGGTDTTATLIEWAIVEILRHPEVIQKAKEELDRVIGRDRWVEENDFSSLPYIEAIIMESMRLHPLATLLGPHYAIEDCKVAGYDISKGTIVLINTWSIGRDSGVWDEPEMFLPERFLEKDVDMLGSNFALMPFGSGRRRCPGYNLGLKIVRTMLANLIHGFEFRLVEGMKPEDICVEEEYGLTTRPKKSLPIIMEPALPSQLY